LFDADNAEYPYKGQLVNLKTKANKNPVGKLLNIFKRIHYVKNIKKELGIDTTLSLLSGPNFINILTRKNDKVVVSVRNFVSKSSKGFYGKVYNLIMKKLYNKADTIVVVSEAIKKDLVKNFGLNIHKIKVVYNPYDIEKIQKLSTEKLDQSHSYIFNNPTIITAGRISEQKGQWHLLRAFKKVKEMVPNAELVILGKGDLVDYIQNLARDLNIANNVHLLGFQSNPFKFISKSAVYVSSSLYEGFPNAMCEAMASGVPVISSDCKSGPREILGPNTSIDKVLDEIEYAEYGVLIPLFDGNLYQAKSSLNHAEIKLYESIVAMIENKAINSKYKTASLTRIKDFSKEKIIEDWIRIL